MEENVITYYTNNLKLAAYLNLKHDLLEVRDGKNGQVWFHFPMSEAIEKDASNYFTADASTKVAPLLYSNSLKKMRDLMYQVIDSRTEDMR